MARLTRWQEILEQIPPPLRNKYVAATAIFVVWMFVFDRNSIWSQYTLQNTLREMKMKKAYFEKEIKEDSEAQKELFTDDHSIEKFAREHHYMKKADEDLFVFEQEKK